MSYDDCYCDYGDPPTFFTEVKYTARIQHKCSECCGPIHPKEQYERVVGKWDGDVSMYKTCCRCLALREHLKAHVRCFCWNFGDMLNEARNAVDNLPVEAEGTGLYFELGRLAVAIRRNKELK